MSSRGRNWATRHTEEFKEFLKNKCSLNEETGEITYNDIYVSLYITIGWKSNSIAVPYSHLVWFLKYGRWPQDGMHIDHKNDKPSDNRPDNLQELTKADNHEKRRNRKVYSNYGSGKYGHGINVVYNKTKLVYEASRYMSRGITKTRKTIREWVGQDKTEQGIEIKVAEYIRNHITDIKPNIFDELLGG